MEEKLTPSQIWDLACKAQMSAVLEYCTYTQNTNGHAIKHWVKQPEMPESLNKQQHFYNESVVNFKCTYPNCPCAAKCPQFYQDEALLKQQESDAVLFAEWIAKSNYEESCSVGMWILVEDDNVTQRINTKQLYQIFKSNNNGNT